MPLRARIEQMHGARRPFAGDLDAGHLIPEFQRQVEAWRSARVAPVEVERRLAQPLPARREGVQHADARCRRRRAGPGFELAVRCQAPAAAASASSPGRAVDDDQLPPPTVSVTSLSAKARRLAVMVDAVGQPDDADVALAAAQARSSCTAAIARSGANGCGCRAAAVERAAFGASMRSVCVLAGGAVCATSTGRLWPSASRDQPVDQSACARQAGGGAQPLSTTSTTGPSPLRAVSRLGLSTGSASARITQRGGQPCGSASATTASWPASSPGYRCRPECASAESRSDAAAAGRCAAATR